MFSERSTAQRPGQPGQGESASGSASKASAVAPGKVTRTGKLPARPAQAAAPGRAPGPAGAGPNTRASAGAGAAGGGASVGGGASAGAGPAAGLGDALARVRSPAEWNRDADILAAVCPHLAPADEAWDGEPVCMPDGPGPGSQGPGGASVLRSGDPQVDGQPVPVAGAGLQARARLYGDGISRLRAGAIEGKRMEEAWYAELGVLGRVVDLFNDAPQTEPARWDVLLAQWAGVEGALAQILVMRVEDETINQLGQDTAAALQGFDAAYGQSLQHRAEFERYLHGFMGATDDALTVTTIARDVGFAAAVGVAVVVAAPVVFGAASGFATGTLGLSGAGATAFATGSTALAMGGLGAGIEAGGQALGTLVVEGGQLVADLMNEQLTWQQAVDRFDWALVAEQGWDGFKRGFVDGLLAYAGMGFERVLSAGARVALERVLGTSSGRMLASMLRRGLERAVAGGVSGGVIGGLDAGIKAAMAGGSLGTVLQAVQDGFVLGAAVGTVLGAGGGAAEGRRAAAGAADTADQVRASVDELQRLLREEPDAFAGHFNALVDGMTDGQRAAFQRELAGRRFVDAPDYEIAARAHEGGSPLLPEHGYGQQAFEDWSEAARVLDEHARTGQPLTRADVEAAHGRAARNIERAAPGQLRRPGPNGEKLIANGGIGPGDEIYTALSSEQLAVLESNPHLRLLWRGAADGFLTPAQRAVGFETAVITYPDADEIAGKLDDFFAWYAANRGAGNPVAFAAEAQQRLISIHPFEDGNGRVSRLIMDHALQSEGLPPALLRDVDMDFMVSPAAWADEVRHGVMTTYELAARHADQFNQAVARGDMAAMAAHWGALLGLGDSAPDIVDWLYEGEYGECR